VGAFRNGWTFMIAAALVAGTALLAVGPVRIGAAEPETVLVVDGLGAEELAA
jgi:hypothetical protein